MLSSLPATILCFVPSLITLMVILIYGFYNEAWCTAVSEAIQSTEIKVSTQPFAVLTHTELQHHQTVRKIQIQVDAPGNVRKICIFR